MPAQHLQGLGKIVVADQVEAEGIAHIGIVGLDCHRASQQLRPLIHAACPVQIGEIDQRRDAKFGSRRNAVRYSASASVSCPRRRSNKPRFEMCLRPVGIDHLCRDELCRGLTKAVCCSGISAKRSVPANARAASMRTVRTGSLSSGAVASTKRGGGVPGTARGAAVLTSGSGSRIAALIAGSEAGDA